MNILHRKIILFIKDENAQALIEYALLLSIFVLVSYGGISLFISAWKSKFNKLKNLRTGFLGIGP